MKKPPPNYLVKLIEKYPNILNGRKNYLKHHQRIIKNINLSIKYCLKKN